MTIASTHPVAALVGDDLPLVLGGNVFGWTADEAASFAVLDAFVAAGGRMVDTADVYSAWAPGNAGGDSERVIGAWRAARGAHADRLVVATKVAKHPQARGLAPTNVRRAAEGSLTRLGVDRIDLYYAHEDDAAISVDEAVSGFVGLLDDGLIGAVGLSNFTADRVRAFVEAFDRAGAQRPIAYQGEFNLLERAAHAALAPTLVADGLTALPYYGLAKGFLTGKYRDGVMAPSGPRAESASAYLDDRGRGMLAALDAVAADTSSTPAAVALAWVACQPRVAAPIASARNVEQLRPLLDVARLTRGPNALTPAHLAALTSPDSHVASPS